jgi:DNA transformation protein
MPGLGAQSEVMLAGAGIFTAAELGAMGAVQAFLAVRRSQVPVSLNLLWALEGALTNRRWQDVAREHRTSLLLALERAEKAAN